MSHRRISSAEKGKGLELGTQQPTRSARVKVPLPDNSELIRKHSMTLIGRVTNKSTQKVWSLIPFFTEHWKTEFKPVGSDLGNGMFQFQFELELDLLSVLEQRPYHYARWMIILQRWEPTISPSFPSLIPFWIKVQGLPVHLWTEATIKCIGEDIGLFEKAEITSLTARMRVHINGLLPLIKESVVEYPNGDEVSTTLVYERLDKHCTKCLRLDHDVKECLVARAEAKEVKAARDEPKGRTNVSSVQGSGVNRVLSHDAGLESRNTRDKLLGEQVAFQFSAAHPEGGRNIRSNYENRGNQHHRDYKNQTQSWREKSDYRRSSQSRGRARYSKDRTYWPSRESSYQRNLMVPPEGSYYREVQKKNPEAKDTGSSNSKSHHGYAARGNRQREIAPELIPQETLNEARGEVRDAMLQYTKSADPSEREARKERLRQAEESGQLE